MRKSLQRFWLAAAGLMLPVLLLLAGFCLPPIYTETYLGAFSDKVETAASISEPRILIAGGSGAAFALRCDLLGEEIPGYRVVNLGMYAGLGSLVSLNAAVEQARVGDIIVFLPEQNEQTLSAYFGSEAMWQAADGHWSLLALTPRNRISELIAQFPYFAARKAEYWIRGTRPETDGIYSRSSFNSWGDIDSVLRSCNEMPLSYDPVVGVSFDSKLPTQEFLDAVNVCAERCSAAGVTMYFAGCPINADAVPEDAGIADYVERLETGLQCRLLKNSIPCIMESGWFYDTNFHLNSSGAVAYTAKLSEWLRTELGITGQLKVAVPEMPGKQQENIPMGDCSDAGCFLYETHGDSVSITGISAEGAGQTELTVPTHYEGLPVVGIQEGALQKNQSVVSLVLQPGIRWIEDGAFRDSQLERLVLDGVNPASCTVGSGVLDGCGAEILVSSAQLGAFRTNYFWSVIADRIQPQIPAAASSVHQEQTAAATGICYDLSNGDPEFILPFDGRQLRQNTLAWTPELHKDGYTLYSWNTNPDGMGTPIVLGGRVEAQTGDILYAQWAKQDAAENFQYTLEDGEASISRYLGSGGDCVLPNTLGGQPVRKICAGAFGGAALNRLILCPGLETVEPGAFSDCAIAELYLFDGLQNISDDSFCVMPDKIHVNAAAEPVFGTSYYATFADKYDYLFSLHGQKKLVLFAGSSTRYGYDCARLSRAFPQYAPANMGVFAYTNARQQLDLILLAMEPEDVLLHAPEFEPLEKQLCETMEMEWHFWAMAEADYSMLDALDLTRYTHVFDSFARFQTVRAGMPAGTYSDSPNGYDDDGYRKNEDTYNQYGDMSMLREGSKEDVMLKYVRAQYTPEPFTGQRLDAINAIYQDFLSRGITVLFTYSPRNRSALTEDSTPENLTALHRLLKEQLCVPVISSIESSLISGQYFYLVDSHLSSEGVRIHTEQIIQDLKPWLK